MLHSAHKLDMAGQEDIEKVIQTLVNAIEEVKAAKGISEGLRRHTVIELHAMMQAFRDYRITGGLSVLRQVESLYFHQSVDSEFKAFLTNHEVGQRVLHAIQAAAAIITIALQLPTLSQTIIPLLPVM